MNKTYTDKYLIKDLTHKQFMKKYGRKRTKYGFRHYLEPVIDDSNREAWQAQILKKNPDLVIMI